MSARHVLPDVSGVVEISEISLFRFVGSSVTCSKGLILLGWQESD